MEKKVIAELPVKVYGEDFKIGIRMWRTISYTIKFELVDIYPNLEPMLRGWFITDISHRRLMPWNVCAARG